jgi:hypothetical protein
VYVTRSRRSGASNGEPAKSIAGGTGARRVGPRTRRRPAPAGNPFPVWWRGADASGLV